MGETKGGEEMVAIGTDLLSRYSIKHSRSYPDSGRTLFTSCSVSSIVTLLLDEGNSKVLWTCDFILAYHTIITAILCSGEEHRGVEMLKTASRTMKPRAAILRHIGLHTTDHFSNITTTCAKQQPHPSGRRVSIPIHRVWLSCLYTIGSSIILFSNTSLPPSLLSQLCHIIQS